MWYLIFVSTEDERMSRHLIGLSIHLTAGSEYLRKSIPKYDCTSYIKNRDTVLSLCTLNKF